MTISLHPPWRPQQWSPEERYRFLSTILESFAGTLELDEVLRRIVNITLDHFGADRALLVHPISEETLASTVRFAVSAPHVAGVLETGTPVQLTKRVIHRALQATGPLVLQEDDPDINRETWGRQSVKSAMMQILRPTSSEPW